jgi:hypothetical protein
MIYVLSILYELESCQFDIETAFLHGDLEERIYMEFPAGYERYLLNQLTRMGDKKIKVDITTSCLLLKKALYGLVQAAR